MKGKSLQDASRLRSKSLQVTSCWESMLQTLQSHLYNSSEVRLSPLLLQGCHSQVCSMLSNCLSLTGFSHRHSSVSRQFTCAWGHSMFGGMHRRESKAWRDQPKPGRLMGSDRNPATNLPHSCCWRASNSLVLMSAGNPRISSVATCKPKGQVEDQADLDTEARAPDRVLCSTKLGIRRLASNRQPWESMQASVGCCAVCCHCNNRATKPNWGQRHQKSLQSSYRRVSHNVTAGSIVVLVPALTTFRSPAFKKCCAHVWCALHQSADCT